MPQIQFSGTGTQPKDYVIERIEKQVPLPDPHPATDRQAMDDLVDKLSQVFTRMCNIHTRDVPRSLVNKKEHFVTDSQRLSLLKRELLKKLEATL